MKNFLKITVITISILLLLAFLFRNKIYRLNFALKMFSGVEQVERFRSIEKYFPTRIINSSDTPSIFMKTEKEISLPEYYNYNGKKLETKKLLTDTDVTGLLVLKNDSILYEKYYRGNTEKSHTIAWSVTKSFVSALVGIAIEEGFIKNINDVAVDYVPELKGSPYENITIKNLLQMSSGISWNEDYSDFDSDINRFGRTLALGKSFEAFVKTLKRNKEQGTYNLYNSSDTQVLGMIISKATKSTLSKYLEDKIWQPIGMENKALWVVDDYGNEFAAAGLSASLKDFARFGKLYLNNGVYNGKRIIPLKWVQKSLTPDAPHLFSGENKNSNNVFGYGYQWWIPEGTENEFLAIGIYNQFIYVNPSKNMIIVKSSANNSYGSTNDENSFREQETIQFFREICKSMEN